MLAAGAARGEHFLISLAHIGMIEFAGQSLVGQEIVGPDEDHVDTFDRRDIAGIRHRLIRFALDDDHRRGVDKVEALARRKRAESEVWKRGRYAASALRRVFRGADYRLRLLGGTNIGRDDAECTAVERTRDGVRRLVRYPDETGQPFRQGGKRNPARSLDRKARMLKIDIDRIESGAAGDRDDLVSGDEANR